MTGAPSNTQLDQEPYLELCRRCTYKINIKIIQQAISKILQTCYLAILQFVKTPIQNGGINSKFYFEIIVESVQSSQR